MNVEQLRKYYKVANNSQLAKELKKGRSTIHDWELNGIPPRTQAAIQVMTDGKLKADKSALKGVGASMIEKLTASITFKCTDEEKILLERIAKSRKQTISELMRARGMDVIQEVQELLKSLQAEFDLTIDTADTRNTSDFELMPSPPIRTTSQKTGAKKAQLCDQLSLICHSNAKQ